jgi:hypothetical protein
VVPELGQVRPEVGLVADQELLAALLEQGMKAHACGSMQIMGGQRATLPESGHCAVYICNMDDMTVHRCHTAAVTLQHMQDNSPPGPSLSCVCATSMAKILRALGGSDFSTSAAETSVACDLQTAVHAQCQQAASTGYRQSGNIRSMSRLYRLLWQVHLPPASRDGTRASANSHVYGSKLLTSYSSQLNRLAVTLQMREIRVNPMKFVALVGSCVTAWPQTYSSQSTGVLTSSNEATK